MRRPVNIDTCHDTEIIECCLHLLGLLYSVVYNRFRGSFILSPNTDLNGIKMRKSEINDLVWKRPIFKGCNRKTTFCKFRINSGYNFYHNSDPILRFNFSLKCKHQSYGWINMNILSVCVQFSEEYSSIYVIIKWS